MNLRAAHGMSYAIGTMFANQPMAADSPFRTPWWYRTEFAVGEGAPGIRTLLRINGMIPSAEVWLNGQLVAEQVHATGGEGRAPCG